MKLRNLMWGACACILTAGCSNDDVAVDKGSNIMQNDGEAYVKVRIAMADGAYSRATTTDGANGYADGTVTEQQVNDVFFVFYKDGIFSTLGKLVKSSEDGTLDNPDSDDNGNTEAYIDAVIALELNEGDEIPNQVIACVNMKDKQNDFINKNLDDAKTQIKASSIGTDGNFAMTSSTYFDASRNEYLAVEVPAFYETEAAALADEHPVTIYVERLAAKITVKANEAGIKNDPITDVPGYVLKFTPEGYVVNETNTKEYYLKNVNATDWADWNWAIADGDHRCFWAQDPNYTSTADGDLAYTNYEDGSKVTIGTSQYCMENTFELDTDETPGYDECTHLLLVGKYDVTTTEGASVDLTGTTLYMLGGRAYIGDNIKEYLLSQVDEDAVLPWYQDGNEWKHPDATSYNIILVPNSDNTITLEFEPEEGKTYFTGEDHTTELNDFDTYNEGLATTLTTTVGAPEAFFEGEAYFAVPIEHFGGAQEKNDTGKYGVVRNHSYILTIDQISGLGEGIYNPGSEIIPTPGKKRYYVAATLNVLSWKTVSQDVSFGE